MLIHENGTILIPGNSGRECPGNGTFHTLDGTPIPRGCGTCAFYACCHAPAHCHTCTNLDCPQKR